MGPTFAHRPLALAGAAALAAAVGRAYGAPWLLAPAALPLAWIARRDRRLALLLLVAAAAGFRGCAPTRGMTGAAPLPTPTPPRLAQASLEVQRCGEDPVRRRAWLVGRTSEGAGLLCSWPGALPDDVLPGARVHATGSVHVPRGATNPGEIDGRARFARAGLRARLYLGELGNLVLQAPARSPIAAAALPLRRLRRTGARTLLEALPHDDGGLAVALIFGWRTGISARDRLLFERTGTLHLLAISGLHLVLLAGGVHAVARRAGLGPRAAAGCTLLVCLLYVPVAGAGAPVRRAAAVLFVYGVALARGRMPDAAGALGGALLLIVIGDPDEVRRAGFWLSFVAAGGIALHAGRWRADWSARHRLLARFPAVQQDRRWRLRVESHLLAALPVSLAAWGATAPLVAWHFGLVTPWAPLTNLVAAPFVALLMPVNLAIACGATALAPVSALLCSALRGSLGVFDALPAGCVSVVPPAAAAIAVWYAGFLLLRVRPRRGLLLLGLAMAVAWPPRPPRTPTLVVLDVGHGQAVLLIDRAGRAALVDAGSHNRPRLGARILRPALREFGIPRLELAVCTHADRDHWSGIADLVGRIPVATFAVGPDRPRALVERLQREGSAIVQARTGQCLWNADGVRIRVLDDGRDGAGASANDSSLVLVVELGDARILLPADRERAGTQTLLRRDLPRCDALLAPHHGGRNDQARALGRRVRPRWLLVSSGAGFADEPTLEAYGAAHVATTARHGAIIVEPGREQRIVVRAPKAPGDTIRFP